MSKIEELLKELSVNIQEWLVKPFTNATAAKKTAIVGVSIIGSVISYTALRYAYDRISRRIYHLPPGPAGIPFIGSAISFGIDQRMFLRKISEEYKSKLLLFYLSSQPMVVFNDIDLIKKYFSKQEFCNRPSVLKEIHTLRSFINLNFNEMHERRKIFAQTIISQSQRNNQLYTKIRNNIEKDLFGEINKCIELNKKWDIRDDIRYITFVAIYGMHTMHSTKRLI